jgi:chorismate-pyruvate lyase
MNSLRQSIEEYLAMRRSLGFKLREAGQALADFAAFMERRRASYITQVRISRKEGQRFTARRSTVSHHVGPVLVMQDVCDFP